MKNMTLERITEVCGGVYYGSEADKKEMKLAELCRQQTGRVRYLFIAVKGEKVVVISSFHRCLKKVHLPYYPNRNCQNRRALISGWNLHLVQ